MTRPFPALIALTAVVAASPVAAQRAAPAGNSAINIPHERYTLPNGLTVILSEDHSTPTVAVDVWYHVGSKNEVPGRTGFAHMFEHVMFTGSLNVPYGMHDRLTQGVGGMYNGSTSYDRTNEYETVQSNHLESSIWMEADRMGFLLDKLDSAKFAAQRDIVQNERRQGIDNQPYGRAFEIMTAALYPPTNPYSWPIVGYLTDLQAASVEDVKNFFRTYYAPSNATLAIVGDFESAKVKALVAKYFGDLPKGQPVTRPTVAPPTMTAEKRIVFEDRVQVPRLYLRWPTVGGSHRDNIPLQVLGQVLSGSRTSRLTKHLVYDKQAATAVNAGQAYRELIGDFGITITPRPGNTLASLEQAADSVLDRLKREGPTTEEMQRATAPLEYGFVAGLESNLGKAETLLDGSVYYGDAGWYKREYAAFKGVTAADVKRVANTYFGPGRLVLSIVPMGKTDLASRPEASTKVTIAPDGARYIMENK